MLVLNRIISELKIKFPSVYSLCFDEIQGEIFVFYSGEKNEVLTKEIRGFLRERVPPSVPVNVAYSRRQLRLEEVLAISAITQKGGSDAC